VDFNFLLVLIIVGPWAAMAFYVQTILNQNFNSLVQAVLPSGSATVTAQGQFAGQTIVFVAFAGLCAFFVLMFLNWMSCCCADTEVQYKRRGLQPVLPIVAPNTNAMMKTNIEMQQYPTNAFAATGPKGTNGVTSNMNGNGNGYGMPAAPYSGQPKLQFEDHDVQRLRAQYDQPMPSQY